MTRTEDPSVIEHRLLELVYTTDAPITAPALAYFAPCSLEDAEKVLDSLVARDRIQMEVGDDGAITYTFPNRHKMAPRVESAPPPVALVPRGSQAITRGRHASPAVAAVLSMFIPGAGQLYTGNVLSALMWFLLVPAGWYLLVFPGILLHVLCVVFAASSAHRLNAPMGQG